MARNPFEQLQDAVAEPRQAFEDIATKILKCVNPDQRRIRIHRGDGGIDSLVGTLGDGGEADVYQVKYFSSPWGNSQKQQIRDAYRTARESKDYQLRKWTLCVATRLTKDDLRWFDEWRKQQDPPIELMDGDDLTMLLADSRCGKVREELRKLDIIGLQSGGPHFAVTSLIRPLNPAKTGLTTYLLLRIQNDGDKTASGIKCTIRHLETYCVAEQAQLDWKRSTDDGRLNPRALRCRTNLNPGDQSSIMGIPLCKRTSFPFWISIRLTANDCPVTELHCHLTADLIAAGKPVVFASGPVPTTQVDAEKDKICAPTSPDAKNILDMILAHSPREDCGFTEILCSNLPGPLEMLCIPNATQAGSGATVMRKSTTLAALNELVQLGWLLPPEENEDYRIYELNPNAPA